MWTLAEIEEAFIEYYNSPGYYKMAFDDWAYEHFIQDEENENVFREIQ